MITNKSLLKVVGLDGSGWQMNNSEENISSQPGENQILQVQGHRWPDGNRVAVKINLTLSQPLSLVLSILDSDNTILVETVVIGTMDTAFELTMHLPPGIHQGLKLSVSLYDDDSGEFDHQTVTLD